jgi:hypothetical protein
MAKVNLTTVPYREAARHHRSDRRPDPGDTTWRLRVAGRSQTVRAIAVVGGTSPAFPQLPTVSEPVFPATRPKPGMACTHRPSPLISSTAQQIGRESVQSEAFKNWRERGPRDGGEPPQRWADISAARRIAGAR